MATEVTRVPGLPVVIIDNLPPIKVPDDQMVASTEAAKLKRELGRPVYRIIGVTKIDLTFSDMVMAMGVDRDQEGGVGDDDVTTIFVGSGELVKMGTNALAEQDQYGGKGKVFMFTTQEEALAFVREREGK
ncbi:MAG: hypothetical protein JXA10_12590 [Anaerolineae bacterium]|nr:hypothetical protein [Anaerolineae bacterium]